MPEFPNLSPFARFSQREASLCFPSTSSLNSEGGGKLRPSFSSDSLPEGFPYQNSLTDEALELIQFVSARYMYPPSFPPFPPFIPPSLFPSLLFCLYVNLYMLVSHCERTELFLTPAYTFIPPRNSHRPPWPFADLSNRLNPSGEVPDLASLVGRIVSVFNHVSTKPLKEGWAKIALQVRDAGFCCTSFSFQIIVCSPFFSRPSVTYICLLTSFLSGPLVVHHTNMLVSRSRLVEEHQ